MKQTIEKELERLEARGNLRTIPGDGDACRCVDLTSNDYLGIAARQDLQSEFMASLDADELVMSSSASRLLSRRQRYYEAFEKTLSDAYGGRSALIFNSGYHANTGLVSALAVPGTMIIADRLVHASIIDGIKLSGAPFERFRHNDLGHLARLVEKAARQGLKPLIVVESVYSMDGDFADIDGLVDLKTACDGAMLYVDEAHGVGIEGPSGLGAVMGSARPDGVDVIVGTLGKALGSVGAYAMMSDGLRQFAVNKARSFIFSTALPPINVAWSDFVFGKAMGMDSERAHLKELAKTLCESLGAMGIESPVSHIQGIPAGDPFKAVEMSKKLRDKGFDVLPIRTPTVPPGTDRLRVSLSASLSNEDIKRFVNALSEIR